MGSLSLRVSAAAAEGDLTVISSWFAEIHRVMNPRGCGLAELCALSCPCGVVNSSRRAGRSQGRALHVVKPG